MVLACQCKTRATISRKIVQGTFVDVDDPCEVAETVVALLPLATLSWAAPEQRHLSRARTFWMGQAQSTRKDAVVAVVDPARRRNVRPIVLHAGGNAVIIGV